MALRAVLFDFGGTLLDTATDDEAHRIAFRWVGKEWSLPNDDDALWRRHQEFMAPYWKGQPGRWTSLRDVTQRSFERLLEDGGREATEEDWDRFWRQYLDAHVGVMKPYPDAAECVDRVGALGIHVGLLSDVDIDFLDFALGVVEMRGRFDAITTSEEAGYGKPNPIPFRLALQKAGCTGEEAVYVGDSIAKDVEGAKGVGMRTVHVHRDGGPAPGADVVAKTLLEVAEAIESWA